MGKITKDKSTPKEPVNQNDTSFVADGPHDVSVTSEDRLDTNSEYGDDHDVKKRSNPIMHFQMEHPLSDSHGVRHLANNANCVPNFVGANLPRCDQDDREYYCHTMLVLFKPWRQGTDLKAAHKLWDNEF